MSRRRRKDLTKLKLRNSTRVSLVMLFLVIFSISSANLFKAIFDSDITKVQEDVYTYENEYNVDYKVNIKDNDFVEENYLPAGQTYLSDLVDSLDMEINYKYTGSEDSLINYDYKIDAVIGASYTSDSNEYSVWNKTYNLKEMNSLESNDVINIQDEIKVDYEKYHNEVKKFKQTLGMAVDAFLYVRLTVNTSTVLNYQEVKNEYISDFSITLGDKIAIVEGKDTDTKVGSVKQENTVKQNNVDVSKVIFSLIIMAVSLYGIYYIRFKTKKHNTIRNEFRLELNRILKSCQDRIVIVKNRIESDDEEIIDVKDFGELIKLSEELYKPILCWISDDINDEQAWFSIISNKIRYRFVLKNK